MAENRKTKVRESLSSDPEGGYFSLSRILSSGEVDPPNPVLNVDPSEAYLLTGCADFILESASGSHSQRLLVLDGVGGVYKLLLAFSVHGACQGYSISQDWAKLVSDHNLKPGDEIFFKRQKIKATLECYYYDFTFDRKATFEVDFRTLSAFEAARHDEKPKLFLDVPLGTFSENLVVFDADKKSYEALLSRPNGDDGKMINTVVRVHTDDEVRHSYRFLEEPYYNVSYARRGGDVLIEDFYLNLKWFVMGKSRAYEAGLLIRCPEIVDKYPLLVYRLLTKNGNHCYVIEYSRKLPSSSTIRDQKDDP